jgi:hypothetical protein
MFSSAVEKSLTIHNLYFTHDEEMVLYKILKHDTRLKYLLVAVFRIRV